MSVSHSWGGHFLQHTFSLHVRFPTDDSTLLETSPRKHTRFLPVIMEDMPSQNRNIETFRTYLSFCKVLLHLGGRSTGFEPRLVPPREGWSYLRTVLQANCGSLFLRAKQSGWMNTEQQRLHKYTIKINQNEHFTCIKLLN